MPQANKVSLPDTKSSRFQWRAFISFTLFLSFFILVLSGLALYLRPEGSIARWTGWRLLGIDKGGWEGIHTLFCLLFLPAAIFHFFINFRVFLHHLSSRLSRGLRFKNELLVSALLIGGVFLFSMLQVRPFWSVMELRDNIKKGAALIDAQPPLQDFDKKTFFEAAVFLNIPVERLEQSLRMKGLKLEDKEESLSDIAHRNRLSPQELFLLMIQLAEQ